MLMRCHRRRSRAGLLLFTIFSCAMILPGCGTLRPRERIVTETVTEYRDSTVWRDTTVYVPIPLEADQAIVHVGDTSHRETSVASSDAWIGADGFLHHDLRNKPVRIPFALKVPERFIMSEARSTQEHALIKTKEVKVEQPLSAWRRLKLGSFWWLLALAAAGWRKQLAWLVKKAAGLFI